MQQRFENAKRQFTIAQSRVTQLTRLMKENPSLDLKQRIYQERIVTLNNSAIEPSARLLWTNFENRRELINSHFEILEQLTQGAKKHDDLKKLELHMNSLIFAEVQRIERERSELAGN